MILLMPVPRRNNSSGEDFFSRLTSYVSPGFHYFLEQIFTENDQIHETNDILSSKGGGDRATDQTAKTPPEARIRQGSKAAKGINFRKEPPVS